MAGDGLTLQEAAAALGVHYMTAYRYVRTGRLPAVKAAGEWRVDPADLARLRQPPPPRRGRRAGQRERLEQRLVAGDHLGAWAVVESAMAAGTTPDGVYLELLGPALESIGERWATGELEVADEHRASAAARRVIGRLGTRFTRRGRKRGVVVVGAPAGERHEVPVAMVADLLRQAGFEVVDFGADTPAASFAGAVRRYRPLAVLIGVTGSGHEASVSAAVRAVRAVGDTPVLVGGRAIADEAAAAAVRADGWSGLDGAAAVRAVEALAARPS